MLNSLIFDIYIPSNYLDMSVENRHIAKYIDSKTINDYLVAGKLKLKDIVENCSLSYVLENVTNIDTLIELYIMCFRNFHDTPYYDAVVENFRYYGNDMTTFDKIHGFRINKSLVEDLPIPPEVNEGYITIKKAKKDILLINKITKNKCIIKKNEILAYTIWIEYCKEMLKNDIVMIEDFDNDQKIYSKAQIHYHTTSEPKGYIGSYKETDNCLLHKYYKIKDNTLVQLSSHCWNNDSINRCKGWIVIPKLLIFDPSNYFQYNIVKQKFFDIDFTIIPYKMDIDILNTIREKIIICNL